MTHHEPAEASAPPKVDAPHNPAVAEALRRYWRVNVMIMSALLAVWAFVGLGCGILFADVLNAFQLGGYPLGFWFAQQGSIMTFVVIILVYCILLNRLDKKHHAELESITQATDSQGGAA